MAASASSRRSSALEFSVGKHKSSDGIDDGSATFSACSLCQTALQSGTKWIKSSDCQTHCRLPEYGSAGIIRSAARLT